MVELYTVLYTVYTVHILIYIYIDNDYLSACKCYLIQCRQDV